jgi:hypothetical protein
MKLQGLFGLLVNLFDLLVKKPGMVILFQGPPEENYRRKIAGRNIAATASPKTDRA